QPEVAARDLFDGRRIVGQPAGKVAKPGVLGALARDRRGELVVFVTGAKHGQKAPVADKAVEDDQRRDEEQQQMTDFSVAVGASGFWGFSPWGGLAVLLRHARGQYNNRLRSTRGKLHEWLPSSQLF